MSSLWPDHWNFAGSHTRFASDITYNTDGPKTIKARSLSGINFCWTRNIESNRLTLDTAMMTQHRSACGNILFIANNCVHGTYLSYTASYTENKVERYLQMCRQLDAKIQSQTTVGFLVCSSWLKIRRHVELKLDNNVEWTILEECPANEWHVIESRTQL